MRTDGQTDRREPKPISEVIGFAIAQPTKSTCVGITKDLNCSYVTKNRSSQETYSDHSDRLLVLLHYKGL